MEKDNLQAKLNVLGPIRELPPGGLRLYPLTLFIGKQGTGKTLMSQKIYFEENSATNFSPPQNLSTTWLSPTTKTCTRTRVRIGTSLGNALYIPAEREFYFYAPAPDPITWTALFESVLLTHFAFVMEEAGETFKKWPNGEPDTEEGKWIHQIGREAFAGAACWEDGQWKWAWGERERLNMVEASSGQKTGWPIVLLAEVLFSWRRDKKIPFGFVLHVDNPEAHLHPEAQVAVVKILAYLVNQGFRVLVTTHSLIVLYTVNNLLAADRIQNHMEPGLPEPEVRLKPGTVGAYLFQEDGRVVSLVDEETGFISEAEMAEVGEILMVQANRMDYLMAYGAD